MSQLQFLACAQLSSHLDPAAAYNSCESLHCPPLQQTKEVMSDSMELVDFADGLVDSVWASKLFLKNFGENSNYKTTVRDGFSGASENDFWSSAQ